MKEEASQKNIFAFPCNVASSANVDQTFKKIVNENKVDCLVNNAGLTSFKIATDNSINEINDIISTNLLGSIYTIKSVLPYCIENGGGTIINVLSVVVNKVFTHSSVYSASKNGLLAYSQSLREEVRQYNIRVVNIIPGATDTSMWPSEKRRENFERMMKPESVARVIVSSFLERGDIVPEEIVLKPPLGDL